MHKLPTKKPKIYPLRNDGRLLPIAQPSDIIDSWILAHGAVKVIAGEFQTVLGDKHDGITGHDVRTGKILNGTLGISYQKKTHWTLTHILTGFMLREGLMECEVWAIAYAVVGLPDWATLTNPSNASEDLAKAFKHLASYSTGVTLRDFQYLWLERYIKKLSGAQGDSPTVENKSATTFPSGNKPQASSGPVLGGETLF